MVSIITIHGATNNLEYYLVGPYIVMLLTIQPLSKFLYVLENKCLDSCLSPTFQKFIFDRTFFYKIILYVNLKFFLFFNNTFFKNHYHKIYLYKKGVQTRARDL